MKKVYFSIIMLAALAMAGCTKHFEDINSNKIGKPWDNSGNSGGSSSAVQDASGFLPSIMQYIYPCNGAPGTAGWVYQIQQNFNSDIYSGFWMQAGSFGHGTSVESNYYLVQGWDDYLFESFKNIINPFKTIQSSAWEYPNPTNETALGMAYTSKVMISVRVADAMGTLPYTSAGQTGAKYDSLSAIYNAFFSELDSATLYLNKNSTSPLGSNDYFYQGDISKWKSLTNSVRLELAMRIVKANPGLAKTQAEKAMATGDLITNNPQNASFMTPFEPAISTLVYTWGAGGSTIPSADVASYLVGYNDPRLPVFLQPTNGSSVASRVATGNYATMRLGSVAVPGDNNLTGLMFSLPGTGILASGKKCTDQPASSTFFGAAETYFLLSEAALRGWNMGNYTLSAEAYYDKGVQANMNLWGVGIGNYLNTSAQPADFKDPTLPDRDIAAVSTCSPKWSDASTNEGHLEQIITQKWISFWPVKTAAAWSEYRRTGYPKLFPAYYSAVRPTIQWGGLQVNNARKIMLPDNEYKNNTQNVLDAVNNILGGTDDIGTHVWWDKDLPNF